eukprot:238383_1
MSKSNKRNIFDVMPREVNNSRKKKAKVNVWFHFTKKLISKFLTISNNLIIDFIDIIRISSHISIQRKNFKYAKDLVFLVLIIHLQLNQKQILMD